jgi:hypothetical protein
MSATKEPIEFKALMTPSPLAQELFKFSYVKEVFIDENYISVTKYEINNWEEITLEIRSFIKQFIENGGIVLDETCFAPLLLTKKRKNKHKNLII